VEFQLLLRLLKGRKEAPSGGEKEAAIYKYSAAAAPSRDSNKFVHRLRNWKKRSKLEILGKTRGTKYRKMQQQQKRDLEPAAAAGAGDDDHRNL